MLPKNIEQAKQLAERLYPYLVGLPSQIPLQGAQCFVILYPEKVVKFPRGEWGKGFLQEEARLLGQLELMTEHSVTFPRIEYYDPENHMTVMSRVAGQVLGKQMMASLTSSVRQDIGGKLGKFLAQLHTMTPVHDSDRHQWLQRKTGYYDFLLPRIDDPSLRERARIPEADIYAIREAMESPEMLYAGVCRLHGDIAIGNLLYDESSQNLGLIDFAGTEIGSHYDEFLRMGNFHPEIEDACIQEYNRQSPFRIDRDMLNTQRKTNSLCRVMEGNSGLEMHFSP